MWRAYSIFKNYCIIIFLKDAPVKLKQVGIVNQIHCLFTAIIQNRSHLERLEELQKSNTKLLVEWNQTHDLFNKCSAESKHFETKINELESTGKQKNQQLDMLRNKLHHSEEKAKAVRTENDKLRWDIGACRHTIDQLRQSNANYRSLRAKHQTEMSEKQKELTTCRTELQKLGSTVTELKSLQDKALSDLEEEAVNKLILQQKQHCLELKSQKDISSKLQKELNDHKSRTGQLIKEKDKVIAELEHKHTEPSSSTRQIPYASLNSLQKEFNDYKQNARKTIQQKALIIEGLKTTYEYKETSLKEELKDTELKMKTLTQEYEGNRKQLTSKLDNLGIKIGSLSEKLSASEKQNAELNQKAISAKRYLQEEQTSYNRVKKEADSLRAMHDYMLKKKESDIARIQKEQKCMKDEYERALVSKTAEIKDKQEQIDSLNAEINSLKSQLAFRDFNLYSAHCEIEDMRSKIEQNEFEINGLTGAISLKSTKIKSLENQVKELESRNATQQREHRKRYADICVINATLEEKHRRLTDKSIFSRDQIKHSRKQNARFRSTMNKMQNQRMHDKQEILRMDAERKIYFICFLAILAMLWYWFVQRMCCILFHI